MSPTWHTWFAQPWALWLLAVLPPLTLLAALARWQRRRALLRLGGAFALQAILAPRFWSSFFRGVCVTLGLVLLVLGIAGPQWGREPNQQVTGGRDLVVVLDLSRSMLAEQPSRQKYARDALLSLADSLQKRGGDRVAVVVFAAKAKRVLPLAQDYDLFRDAIKQQDAARLPPELLPDENGPESGTRIGAALRLAVETFEEGDNPRAILLVSDGVDPADDGEWNNVGVVAAVAKRVPVHVVGFGDPETPRKILVNDRPLRYREGDVESTLQEWLLQQIAERTGGTYVAARRFALPPDALYEAVLGRHAAAGSRPGVLPRYRQYHPWFFGGALALLTLATLIRPRRAERGRCS
jgi:Ca-activated chloride channel family protein